MFDLQLLTSAAHGESSSLEASSGDLHGVTRRLLAIDEKQVMWPPQAGRGLAHMFAGDILETSARRLQGGQLQEQKGPCVRSLLHIVEPVKMKEWRECFDLKLNTSNMKVAGAVFAANMECWCEKDVQPVLEEYGCRNHPDFELLFQAKCKPDCATAKAKKCVADCPAVCLESDYAPEFCRTSCTPCLEEIMCITEHSKKMTGTHPDNPLICDDLAFDVTPNWGNWRDCYNAQPKRTHWHRHNAENYCYCKADLKKAATDNHCCNASWGKTICDTQCSDAKANINCDSAEGTSCMQTCNTKCKGLHRQTVTKECTDTCLSVTSSCAKYSICKPIGHFEFDYVCDDGIKPSNDGCCPGSRAGTVGCPTMCDSGAPNYPVHFAAGYQGQHGLECKCTGCPSSKTASTNKLSKTLTDDLWVHGVASLATISKEVGILGANRRMQELMKERNEKIMKLHETESETGTFFQAKVDSIVAEYRKLIVVEAKRFKAAGEKPLVVVKPGVKDESLLEEPQGRGGKGGQKDGNIVLIVVAVSVAGVALLMCLLGVVYKFGKAKGGKNLNPANTGDMIPVDGDSNVVLGRPVELGGAVQGETALGGIVQPSVGGKGDKSAAAADETSKV